MKEFCFGKNSKNKITFNRNIVASMFDHSRILKFILYIAIDLTPINTQTALIFIRTCTIKNSGTHYFLQSMLSTAEKQ